ADEAEAGRHYVPPPVGQLPLGEERAIVELKARWLLGDVDVDRCPVKTAAIVSANSPASICLLPRSDRAGFVPGRHKRERACAMWPRATSGTAVAKTALNRWER